ncbi:ATPase [Candidatus Scalindua japonica]|uniref:ATPase n=2 Tax=Candidatus Scalindua japonica TaxID=1284222 RepID=A0A286U0B4_9BACT|nr:ATPase [Candidatus Scalindua japonica]
MVDRLEDYAWSSHNGYLSKSSKWNWLNKEAFFGLLTDVKSKRLAEYREFIREEDSDDIVGVFSKKKMPIILGAEKFIEWAKEKYTGCSIQEEIPETKVLVPSRKKIKDSVCKVYNVDIGSLYGIHRGVTNEARNVAIYLTRLLRRDSLKEIGKEFKVSSYSSVSSIIEKTKVDVVRSKKLKKQVNKARKILS